MKHLSRGYTLVEMMVVVAIVGIIAVVAVPVSRRMRERADFNSIIREYQGKLALARTLSVGAAGNPAWAPTDRVRSAGIRMVSPTQYTVFIDRDTTAGGEVTVSIVDLQQAKRDNQITIVAPAEIRLNNSGALMNTAAPVNIVFTDSQDALRTKSIRVSLSGMPRIL